MYLMKVWKQAGSLAVVVPKAICQASRIKAGSHVAFSLRKDGSIKMQRVFQENGELAIKRGGK